MYTPIEARQGGADYLRPTSKNATRTRMPSLSTITVNSRIQNTTSLQVTASDTPRTCQVPPISLQRSGSTDEEDRPHSRAQAVIHFSDIFAPLLFCLFAFYFLVCGLQGQVKASEEPTTNSYNATPAPAPVAVQPTKGSGWK